MNNEQCNGWTNRETWGYNLHLTNTKAMQAMVREWLQDSQFAVSNPTYYIEHRLKEFLNTAPLDIISDVGSDWRVNYREIAEHLIKDRV